MPRPTAKRQNANVPTNAERLSICCQRRAERLTGEGLVTGQADFGRRRRATAGGTTASRRTTGRGGCVPRPAAARRRPAPHAAWCVRSKAMGTACTSTTRRARSPMAVLAIETRASRCAGVARSSTYTSAFTSVGASPPISRMPRLCVPERAATTDRPSMATPATVAAVDAPGQQRLPAHGLGLAVHDAAASEDLRRARLDVRALTEGRRSGRGVGRQRGGSGQDRRKGQGRSVHVRPHLDGSDNAERAGYRIDARAENPAGDPMTRYPVPGSRFDPVSFQSTQPPRRAQRHPSGRQASASACCPLRAWASAKPRRSRSG